MLYEIHMIKNYPPTNLNRDETGAPKTCVFGGTTRGRISSQCLKRTWRTSELFKEEVGSDKLGIRTRRLPDLVAENLQQKGVDPEYIEAIKPRISGFGNKDGKETKDGNITAQVIFYAPQDIEAVAKAVKEKLDTCATLKDVNNIKAKELQSLVKDADIRPITLDIALFGRMVTSDAFRDVEAAMQVAHAISTNKVSIESDYFTAMDDLLDGSSMGDSGAAMIGDTDFNASCFYVYAALDTDALEASLSDAEDVKTIVKNTVSALLKTIAFTNPSGKQNSFAGNMMPSAFLVDCKEKKIPTSFANAFVKPVSSQDFVEESIKKLSGEADSIAANFGIPVKERLWFCVNKYDISPESATKRFVFFPDLVEEAASLIE